tara:strand:- start:8562 stop:8663 length:102 start_codon:yes stop_codon:yes gene_type:complete
MEKGFKPAIKGLKPEYITLKLEPFSSIFEKKPF